MTAQWIEEVTIICRTSGSDYVDMIFDQAGMDSSVISALNVLSVEWQSLYYGLPEEFIVDEAPLVARMMLNDSQQIQWLKDISQQIAVRTPLLLFCSHWSFSAITGWLTQCIDALQEGRSGIFRFYDTRIFPLLFTHVLNEEQKKSLLRPVLFWAWQDMDGNARGIKGHGRPLIFDEKPKKIDLSDRQLEHLMCVCDAIVLLSHATPPEGRYLSKQSLFDDCYQGMVEATNRGFILDEAREDWVMEKWRV